MAPFTVMTSPATHIFCDSIMDCKYYIEKASTKLACETQMLPGSPRSYKVKTKWWESQAFHILILNGLDLTK